MIARKTWYAIKHKFQAAQISKLKEKIGRAKQFTDNKFSLKYN